MQELCARGEYESLACKQLINWKRTAATSRSQDNDVAASRKALNEVFRARICMKRSGSNY